VQETHFVHVRRRAEFVAIKLGTDAGDYVADVRPLVADHPYRNLIEYYGRLHSQGPRNALSQLKDLDIVDVTWKEMDLVRLTWPLDSSGRMQGKAAFDRSYRHQDDAAPDLELQALQRDHPQGRTDPKRVKAMEATEQALPFSPQDLAARIEADWEKTAPRVAQIERDFGNHPTVGMALARQYQRLKRYNDAIRCLNRYITNTPDIPAYQMLAEIELTNGDEAAWLRTLETALRQEDLGLQHAAVNSDIARHYMEAGKFDAARPYASAAAGSGASWAMRDEAACEEGLGNWWMAESIVRDLSQHYTEESTGWYYWCVRTGHGDVASAKAQADDYLRKTAGRTEFMRLTDHALMELLQGRASRALALFRQQATLHHDPWSFLHVALLEEAAHNPAARDQALVQAEHPPAENSGYAADQPFPQLAGLFRRCYQTGSSAKLPVDAAEKIAASSRPYRTSCLYFIGKFLDLRGDHDAARSYYSRCAQTLDHQVHDQVLAAWELRGQQLPKGSFVAKFNNRPMLAMAVTLVVLVVSAVVRAIRNR
jgi:tetratricopeptide (TPR) repeat protein